MMALFGIPLAVAHAEDARSLATQALAAYQSKNYKEHQNRAGADEG